MHFTNAIFLVAVAFVASVNSQSCNDGKGHFGTCKLTKDCHGPEFQSVPPYSDSPYFYFIPQTTAPAQRTTSAASRLGALSALVTSVRASRPGVLAARASVS
ncbi:hypothetical protein K438DRAFT_1784468 [Mycena galopus ATCC 62051]|nr:hypothetical protein K438DRAFT_1784468 [Mycena galopus ATCC 62051]